eukprot:TRINITY_DN6369_c4_g1_i1.p1 TRINITY_DN6369_c4_g1~~TRINITY_DN6369_c4_g1_i1.p1  ORF type:complete len:244 (+),score=37.46 TRINITY_DN6369_c4_g1_i1:53-784(+)
MSIILYGVPLSQPFRACAWLMMMKKCPFEVQLVIPGAPGDRGSRGEKYLKTMPTGMVPALQDGNKVVGESHAILTYLCEKNGWSDMFPSEAGEKASINEILFWHQRTLREASVRLFAKHVRKDRVLSPEYIAEGVDTVTMALYTIETGYLKSTPYLNSNRLTIADLSAYTELGQLYLTNLFDFTPFPKVRDWLERMSEVPCHDVAFKGVMMFGDLRKNTVTTELLRTANKTNLKLINETVAKL